MQILNVLFFWDFVIQMKSHPGFNSISHKYIFKVNLVSDNWKWYRRSFCLYAAFVG